MDSADVLGMLQEVAAQIITPHFRSLADDEVFEKAPGDLVTVADRQAEQELTRKLREAFPRAVIVGEEASAADPSLLEGLTEPEQLFLIDPIDGTRNYVQGHDDHAVMVAEVHRGETVRSWIWQPMHKLGYVAERGAGLWCNGERVTRPESGTDPADWAGVAPHSDTLNEVNHGLAPVRRAAWCCGVDYPRLATGETDYLIYRGSKPWDHLPGVLMVTETGGVARRIDGAPYSIDTRGGGLLAAANADIWQRVHDGLFADSGIGPKDL
ncbi:inositol monophosphatase family protein [Enemella sp. A6]|uniref:inositol monophosphatase family protein n=1 Tax=Enemella sp. A6 TaxID=3440152 RepID=UPI003EB88BA9